MGCNPDRSPRVTESRQWGLRKTQDTAMEVLDGTKPSVKHCCWFVGPQGNTQFGAMRAPGDTPAAKSTAASPRLPSVGTTGGTAYVKGRMECVRPTPRGSTNLNPAPVPAWGNMDRGTVADIVADC
jgi:hypothetical protein